MRKQTLQLSRYLRSTVLMATLLILAVTKTNAQSDSLINYTTWTDSVRYLQEFGPIFGTLAGDDTVYLSSIGADSVVGVNDGLDSSGVDYYTSATDGNIYFNGTGTYVGLLVNDIHADSFANLTVLHGAGTLNVTHGGGSTIAYYTPGVGDGMGMILLSYVPYNRISGMQGHPTYVFLSVWREAGCAAESCQLVINGAFAPSAEPGYYQCGSMYANLNHPITSPTTPAKICDWTAWMNSPDVYAAGCGIYITTPPETLTIPTPASASIVAPSLSSTVGPFSVYSPSVTTQSIMGLVGAGYIFTYTSTAHPNFYEYSDEGAVTELAAPLIPGMEYNLDFDGLVAGDLTTSVGSASLTTGTVGPQPWLYQPVIVQFFVRTINMPGAILPSFYPMPMPLPTVPIMTGGPLVTELASEPVLAGGARGFVVNINSVTPFNHWQHTTYTFTYNGPAAWPLSTSPQFLGVVNAADQTAIYNGIWDATTSSFTTQFADYVYLANISITPVLHTPSVIPNPICPGTAFTLSPVVLTYATGFSYSTTPGYRDHYTVTPTTFITSVTTTTDPHPDFTGTATTATTVTYNTTESIYQCSSIATLTVYATPTVTPTNTGPLCLDLTAGGTVSVTLHANVSGGSGSISYTWSGPGLIATTGDPATAVYSATGTYVYTLFATDMLTGCTSAIGTTTVTVNPIPTLTVTASTYTICPGSTATLTATASDALPGTTFSYVWSYAGGPIGTDATITVSPTVTTTYSVTATDNTTGCTGSTTYTLTVYPAPTVTASNSGPICGPGSVTLTATPTGGIHDTYVWTIPPSGGGGLAIGSPTVVTATATDDYAVTVTDGNGCTADAITTVTVNPVPTLTVTAAPDAICPGGNSTLTATASDGTATTFSYAWSYAGGPLGTDATITVSPTITTTYSVTATDNTTGCTGATTYTLTVYPAPMVTATNTSPICGPGSVDLTTTVSGGTPGYTYLWTLPPSGGSGTVTGSSSITVTATATDDYSVTVTDAEGCTVDAITTVTVNPVPTISGSPAICAGYTIGLTAIGPPAVSGGIWSISATGVATIDPTTGIVTAIAAGTATVVYTTPDGCTATFTLSVNEAPTITGVSTLCQGDIITLIGAPTTMPPGTWSCFPPGAVISIDPTSGDVTGINPGTATITYTLPTTTCFATFNVTVNPTPTIMGPLAVCPGSTITLSAAGPPPGVGGGTWSLSTIGLSPVATIGSSTGVVTGITAGTATVTYITPDGCSATYTITVYEAPGITGPTALCVGDMITLSGTPTTTGTPWGSMPGAISIDPSSGVVTGMSPGFGTVTYTSPDGCTATYTITVNPLPMPITGTTTLCVGDNSPLNDPTPGGTWSITPTTVAIIGVSGMVTAVGAGTATVTYSLTSTGCATTVDITVNPTPTITGTDVCIGATTTLTATPPGGTWTWTGGTVAVNSGTGEVTGLTTGDATITYTSPDGCVNTYTITVNPNPGPINGAYILCVDGITELTGMPPGGTWSVSPTTVATVTTSAITGTGTVTGISIGTVTATYTLPTGCFVTATLTVIATATVSPGYTATVCTGGTCTLTNTTAGGGWTGSSGIASVDPTSGVVTGLSPGMTTITYTAGNVCSVASAIYTITVLPAPDPGTITGPTDICPPGSGTYTLTGGLSGGTWDVTGTGVSFSMAPPWGITVTGTTTGIGVITYSVTNASGCSAVATFTVTFDGSVSVTATPAAILCGSVTLSASVTVTGSTSGSGIIYAWSPTVGLTPATGATVTCSGITTATVYTVTAWNGACYGTATVTVDMPYCSEICGSTGILTVTPIATGGTLSGTITGTPTTVYYINNPVYPAAYTVTVTGSVYILSAVIKIAPNVTLVMATGSSMHVSSSHLLCCDVKQMWNGIVDNNSSTIFFYNECLVEDAVTAIKVNNPVPGAATILETNGVVFNKCHTGISINNCANPIATTPPFILWQTIVTSRDFSAFTGFGATYPFAWPYEIALVAYAAPANPVFPPLNLTIYTPVMCNDGTQANVGVNLSNIGPATGTTYPAITVGQDNIVKPENTAGYVFDNLQYGIYANNANVVSVGNVFMYMQAIGTGSVATAGDGIYAIHPVAAAATTTSNYGLTVGSTHKAGNFFYDCRDGVECTGYTYMSITYAKMWSDHTSTVPANAYIDGNTGINLASSKYSSITVDNNYVSNYMNGITFSSMNQRYNGSLIIIGDTIIGDPKTYFYPLGSGFCNVGIMAMNALGATTTIGSVKIQNCEIVNVYNGIEVNNFSIEAVTTSGNEIAMIPSVFSTATQYGIQNTNCGRNTIQNNYVTGDATSTTILVNGIAIQGADARTTNTIKCNSENYCNIGFDFQGATNPTIWNKNVMAQNNIGMQFNGVIGNQGTSAVPADNYWVAGGWSAIYPQTLAYSNALFNLMWVRNISPTFNPVFNNVGGLGVPYVFTVSLMAATPARGYITCVPAVPTFAYSTFRTMSDSSGIDSAEVDTTISQSWSSMKQGFESIVTLSIDSLADSTMSVTDIAQRNWVAQKRVYDDIRQDSKLADSSYLLSEFYGMVANSRFAWFMHIDSFLEYGDTTAAQTLLSYGTDYFAVSANDTTTRVTVADNTNADAVVNNYVNIYTAYLHYLKGNITGIDSINITAVASQCPMEYGAIVYSARSLYWDMYRNTSIFTDVCPPDYIGWRTMQHTMSSVNNDTTQAYALYPNPNNGKLVLLQKQTDNNAISLTITNIVGQTLFTQMVLFSNKQYSLQLPAIAKAGIYFLQIKDTNHTYNLKFVVE